MFRGSEEYARIAEPLPDEKLQKFIFKFEKTQNSEIFGITKKGGIVYIKNPIMLKQLNQSQHT